MRRSFRHLSLRRQDDQRSIGENGYTRYSRQPDSSPRGAYPSASQSKQTQKFHVYQKDEICSAQICAGTRRAPS